MKTFGSDQANAISDVIHENKMDSLTIIYPQIPGKRIIEPEAIQIVFKAIRNCRSLTSIRFESTQNLSIQEIHVIAAALRKNKFLIRIELKKCNLEINRYEILLEALKENGTLKILKIECPEHVLNQINQLLNRNQKIADLLARIKFFDPGYLSLEHFLQASTLDEKLKVLQNWSDARIAYEI